MSESDAQMSADDIRSEIVGVLVVTLGLVLALTLLAPLFPFLQRNLTVAVAVVFLGAPYMMVDRRGRDPRRFGITTHRFTRGLAWGLGAAALTVLPFAVGYWAWASEGRNHSMFLSLDNYRQWPVSERGRPPGWGRSTGVWTWTDKRRLHIGLKRGARPMTLEIQCQPQCQPEATGSVRLDRTTQGSDGERWIADVTDASARAHLTIRAPAPPPLSSPDAATISVTHPDDVTLHRGPSARPVAGSTTYQRSYTWLILWLLTQIALIALPEEFFYRGYLQTRIRDWWRRRRPPDAAADATYTTRDGEETTDRPAWLGITPENAITSAIFACGHLFIPVGGQILANRAAVFFPALVFGWLRDRTGYITAAVTYHASCNMMVILAAPHFFA